MSHLTMLFPSISDMARDEGGVERMGKRRVRGGKTVKIFAYEMNGKERVWTPFTSIRVFKIQHNRQLMS